MLLSLSLPLSLPLLLFLSVCLSLFLSTPQLTCACAFSIPIFFLLPPKKPCLCFFHTYLFSPLYLNKHLFVSLPSVSLLNSFSKGTKSWGPTSCSYGSAFLSNSHQRTKQFHIHKFNQALKYLLIINNTVLYT